MKHILILLLFLTACNGITGDINGDGKVTITDLVQLRLYVIGELELDSS